MDERSRFRGTFSRNRSASSASADGAVAPQHHGAHQPTHQSAQPAEHNSKKSKKLGLFYGRKWLVVVIILVVAVFGVLTYEYINTKNQLNDAKNPTAAGNTEAEKITNQVSKSVELPSGEAPTLATVNDVSKLKAQAFFKNAQNGDKVLVYTKAGKALLYRPSTQKVIVYSFVNSGSTDSTQSSTP